MATGYHVSCDAHAVLRMRSGRFAARREARGERPEHDRSATLTLRRNHMPDASLKEMNDRIQSLRGYL